MSLSFLKIALIKGGKKATLPGVVLASRESGTDNPLALRAAPFFKGEYCLALHDGSNKSSKPLWDVLALLTNPPSYTST
jgi:hypothetical protein